MDLAGTIFTVAGGIAAVLGIIGSYTWWVYRRGQASGEAIAERKADQRAQTESAAKVRILETQLAAIQAELDSFRPRRRRA